MRIEALESRLLLSSDSVAWGNAGYLTLSFAPDGTNIQESSSSLFATLQQLGAEEQWQRVVFEAFDQWASKVNADIGVVNDSGDAFGTDGRTKHDERFGDIRIGARPLGSDVFALSVPPSVVSGTWVGDLIINSDSPIQSLDELYRIALHEAGNIFGLKDNDEPDSPLFSGNGIPTATEPTELDIASLEFIYGARQDFPEFEDENDVLDDATQIEIKGGDFDGSTPLIVYGDIQSSDDLDFYRFDNLEQYEGAISFQVRSRGISLLQPRISVLDAGGNLIQTAQSSAIGGDVVTIQLNDIEPDGRVFLEVASSGDTFAVGGYSLVATFDDALTTPAAEIDAIANGRFRFFSQDEIQEIFFPETEDDIPLLNDDRHSDDSIDMPTSLEAAPGFVEVVRYNSRSSFSDSDDIDFYKIRSAALGEIATVATLQVRSADGSPMLADLRLFDRDGVELQGQIVVNNSGDFVAQFENIEPNRDHFVQLVPLPNVQANNYELSVSFDADAIVLEELATGSVGVGQSPVEHAYDATVNQMVHFVLESDSPVAETVAVTVRDSDGEIETQFSSNAPTVSANALLLAAGVYTIEVSAVGVGTTVNYRVLGIVITDPLAIPPDDPIDDPVVECPNLDPDLCIPGDADLDGDVDWTDFEILVSDFGTVAATWQMGDFDDDGLVGLRDYVALANHFGTNNITLPRNQFQIESRSDYPSLPLAPISPILGDLDGDGDVDSADRTLLNQHWTGAVDGAMLANAFIGGDIDGDGDVDASDTTLFSRNWTGAR